MMVPMENRFARTLKSPLARQWTYAATEIENGHVAGIDGAVRSQSGRLKNMMRAHLRSVTATFKTETERAINQMLKANEFWTDTDDWITSHTTKMEKAFTAGQIEQLHKIVRTGVEAGLSYVTIAKDVKAMGIRNAPWKAMRIARTETHNAAIKSTDTQMQSARLVYKKRWVAAIDARTRTTHAAMNRHKTVKKGEMFTVGAGNKMEFPGDGSHGATAGEVVNCRCVLLYEVDKSAARRVPARPTGTPARRPAVSKPRAPSPARLLRTNLAKEEKRIAQLTTHEECVAFDTKTGKEAFRKSGGKSNIDFTQAEAEKTRGSVFTHNHPSGQSFSVQDIVFADRWRVKEIRAVGLRYEYKMTMKLPAYEPYIIERYTYFDKVVRADFQAAIDAGKMTYRQAEKNHYHEVWKRFAKENSDYFKYSRRLRK